MDCVTDTHTLIWYLFASPKLSADAKTYLDRVALSGGYIFIPTISFVEITYLAEKEGLEQMFWQE
jgi:PIN domain nuclease of toxin-antitoxin system